MAVMKTPGVYIIEKNAFPNSVVQVATAVPAFIGYTEKAVNGNVSLDKIPHKITSMLEFESFFGGAPKPEFKIELWKERPTQGKDDPKPLGKGPDDAVLQPEMPQAEFTAKGPTGSDRFELFQTNTAYALYGAMRLFFLNGGGACYVTSIGTYDEGKDKKGMIKADPMIEALDRLKKEPEPTMIVIPETTRLSRAESIKVQQAMLAHCGAEMKNRFAILDIAGGYMAQKDPRGHPVELFRNELGIDNLDYGAAYYPWLHTSVFTSRNFTFENIAADNRNKFISLLKRSEKNDKNKVPEIERVGTPILSGDFTISVETGEPAPLKTADVSAWDDASGATGLTYTVQGKPEELPDQMAGILVKKGTKEPLLMEFTQQEIEAGEIIFIHNPEKGDNGRGQFKVVVTDETGIATAARRSS